MILTLLCAGTCLLGIVMLLIYKYKIHDIYNSLDIIGLLATVIGGVSSVICIILIAISHGTTYISIHDTSISRENIMNQIECLENNYEDMSKVTVMQRAYDWNQSVYSAKYWSDNIWTNWFWSKEYTDSLEYINIDKEIGSESE